MLVYLFRDDDDDVSGEISERSSESDWRWNCSKLVAVTYEAQEWSPTRRRRPAILWIIARPCPGRDQHNIIGMIIADRRQECSSI